MARAFAKAFYRSKAWLDTRESVLQRDDYLCQRCGRPAAEVHHIRHLTPENINDPEVAVNPDNLTSLCRDCHFEVHREARAQACQRRAVKHYLRDDGTYFDDSGQLRRQKVYLVCGAPASGKTSYVRQHRERGDLVLDLDALRRALTQEDNRDDAANATNLLDTFMRVRACVLDAIASQAVDSRNVWVLSTQPDGAKRRTLADKLHAEVVLLDAPFALCKARAAQDASRTDKSLHDQLIDHYFRNFTP